jgi:hypothetical protein
MIHLPPPSSPSTLQDFESELERGEQLVAVRQMTMEVGEAEHIVGRIGALRNHLARRRENLQKRREIIQSLGQFFLQCQQMLDVLARNCKTPRHSPKRLKAPMDEEEEQVVIIEALKY